MPRKRKNVTSVIQNYSTDDPSDVRNVGSGDGDAETGADQGTDTRSSGTGSGTDSTGEQYGHTGPAGRKGNESGDDISRIFDPVSQYSIGSERTVGQSGRADDSGRGSGRGRSRANQRSAKTETGTRNDKEPIPREVKDSELGLKNKLGSRGSALTGEFFAEGLSIAFLGISKGLKDEDWILSEEEASEIGDRTANWIRSLDAKTVKSWEKRAEKWQPAAMLVMGLGALVIPRALGTLEKRKNAKSVKASQETKQPTGSGSGASAASTPPVASGPIVAEAVRGTANRPPNGKGPSEFIGIAVRREDGAEFFDGDNG